MAATGITTTILLLPGLVGNHRQQQLPPPNLGGSQQLPQLPPPPLLLLPQSDLLLLHQANLLQVLFVVYILLPILVNLNLLSAECRYAFLYLVLLHQLQLCVDLFHSLAQSFTILPIRRRKSRFI